RTAGIKLKYHRTRLCAGRQKWRCGMATLAMTAHGQDARATSKQVGNHGTELVPWAFLFIHSQIIDLDQALRHHGDFHGTFVVTGTTLPAEKNPRHKNGAVATCLESLFLSPEPRRFQRGFGGVVPGRVLGGVTGRGGRRAAEEGLTGTLSSTYSVKLFFRFCTSAETKTSWGS